jgi:hypothetical protein
MNDSRNPQIRIFLSYIFLSAKPKQENVGEENKGGRFLKSSYGSSRTRMFLNSIGEPSDSRQR